MKNLSHKLTLASMIALASTARADTLNLLGTAGGFAVFGGATVTSAGVSTLTGNLGAGGGTGITGFPPGTVTGSIFTDNSITAQADRDALSAFQALAGMAASKDLTGQDLGGQTLAPGVYSFSSSAQLTGTLTLDFGGQSNSVIVIQTGSTLTTASGASVSMFDTGSNDSVYWEIGSSATLGTNTAFAGYLLAAQSITLDQGASIANGSALAVNGSVTLDGSTVTLPVSVPPAVLAIAPEPATLWLLATGIAGLTTLRTRESAAS